MKVLVLVYGTRGDVQPCVVLAHALKRAGHDAVVAGPQSSERLAATFGVPFKPLDNGLTRLWDNPHTQRAEASGGSRGLPALRAIAEAVRRPAIPSLPSILEDAWAAANGVDLVVHSGPLLASVSYYIAQKLGVPLVLSQIYPLFTPTKAFPAPIYRFPRGDLLPGICNRATYHGMLRMLSGFTGRAVETWRRQSLSLPARRAGRNVLRRPDGGPVPVLNAVSANILRPPPDWPDWVHTTGYWLPPALRDWAPSRGLADFLAAGPPPVYIGFGSMAAFDLGMIRRLAADVSRRAGVRVVAAGGAGASAASGADAAGPPSDVFLVGDVPHDWLFPRVAAVVHHGGPNTAATAIAAGRPQIICPFMADQPFWGDTMQRLGLAPAPMPHATLTSKALAGTVRTVLADDMMAQRAQTLGRLVRAEDGATAAVAVLEKSCGR